MAGWGDIPNELTLDILHIFASRSATKRTNRDLLSMMLVCRRFHAILEPIVYATPHILNSGEAGSSHDAVYAPLRRFARTIVSRPSLGILVKEIHVHCDQDAYYDVVRPWSRGRMEEAIEECIQDFNQNHADALLALLPDAAQHDMRSLIPAAIQKGLPNGFLLKGGCPGLIILLLHYFPSLTSFSANVTMDIAIVGLAALGVFQGGVPIGLLSTRVIDLECVARSQTAIYIGYILPFWNLPSLVEFSCRGAYAYNVPANIVSGGPREDSQGFRQTPYNPLVAPVVLEPQSSGITHIRLEDTLITTSGILHLMLYTPRLLESFHYSLHTVELDVSYAPRDIYRGLCSQKETLTEIFVTCSEWASCSNRADQMGTFNNFSSLRHLKLPAAALIHFEGGEGTISRNPLDDLLPASLVTVELDVGGDAFAGYDAFLNTTGLPYTLLSTSHSLPRLRTLNLIGCARLNGKPSCHDLPLWSNAHLWSAGHDIKFTMTG